MDLSRFKIRNPIKKIGARLTTMFIVIAVAPAAAIGIYAVLTTSNLLTKGATDFVLEHIEADMNVALGTLEGAVSDVKFLASSASIRQYLREASSRRGNTSGAISALGQEFQALASSRKIYRQIRYIDEKGMERVRVDYDGKQAKLLPRSQLASKASSGYFTETMQLPSGEIYVSELNLNREGGKISEPHQPTIRYAAPLFYPDGRRAGLVIANVNAETFTAQFNETFLVNKEGAYLWHHDKNKRFGGKADLNKPETLFQSEDPQEFKRMWSTETDVWQDAEAGHGAKTWVLITMKVPGTKDRVWKVVQAANNNELLAPVFDFEVAALEIAGIGLVFTLLVAFFSTRGITKPLYHIVGTLGKISSGETLARTKLDTQDELQQLGDAFDSMMDERGRFMQSEEQNEMLNNSVIGILRSVSQLGKGDLTVKAPVNEDITGALADAINHMSVGIGSTLGQVSEASDQVRSASAQAKAITDRGKQTVLGTAAGMNEIRTTIQETAKRIKRLGERSQEIGGIVKIIDDIAERTNVLALNANMQAAQAGEAGRGFMVVADEVQRLAESSKQATEQISKLIAGIQAETGDTIATMDKAIEEVVQGGELAEAAARQMDEVESTVTELDAVGQQLLQAVQAFKIPGQEKKAGGEPLKAVG